MLSVGAKDVNKTLVPSGLGGNKVFDQKEKKWPGV
jgi:hypothetical protein